MIRRINAYNLRSVLCDYYGKKRANNIADNIMSIWQIFKFQREETFFRCLKQFTDDEVKLTAEEMDSLCEDMIEKVLFKMKPDFIPNGFYYLDGSIAEGNYRIISKYGDIFTWVEGCILKDGTVIDGQYWSSYPISCDKITGNVRSVPTDEPICGVNWQRANDYANMMRLGGLGAPEEWDAVCEQIADIEKNSAISVNVAEQTGDKMIGGFYMINHPVITSRYWYEIDEDAWFYEIKGICNQKKKITILDTCKIYYEMINDKFKSRIEAPIVRVVIRKSDCLKFKTN